jgi:hypothetical protein
MKEANEQIQLHIDILKENELEKLEVNNKTIDFSILDPYEVELKYMIDYYHHIFQLIKENEGNSDKLDEEYRSNCATLFTKFVELIELIQACIKYHPDDNTETYIKDSLNTINEAMKDDDISKSYENIINNINHIKDVLIKKIKED